MLTNFRTKSKSSLSFRSGYGGECRGYIPPTRPKEVLTRHFVSLKIIAKNIFVLYITRDAKNQLMLISRKRFFVSLDELALIMEPDIKIINDRMGVRRAGEAKRAFAPRLEIGIQNQIFLEKNWSQHLNSD